VLAIGCATAPSAAPAADSSGATAAESDSGEAADSSAEPYRIA